MSQGRVEICLVLVLTTIMLAQYSWAQPNPNCMPAIASLSPCLGFITGNSSTPSSSCCTQLASVVQTQAQCLCTVLNGGAPQLPFVVNQTQALTLPGACNIQTPSVSQCNAVSGSSAPAPAPASSETPSAATAPLPSTPSVPSGTTTPKSPATPSAPSVPSAKGGSKTSPPSGASSSAISTKFTSPIIFLLVAASLFSSF